MNILNFFYQNPPKKTTPYNRKKAITQNKLIIKGAIGSGKKTLALQHAKESGEEFLYIDEMDIRFDSLAYEHLEQFINQNNIKILIINEPQQNINIPKNIEKIYILTSNKDFILDGFDVMWLDFLDFEEFISFYNKNLSISMFFSLYILNGRMPKEESSVFLQNHLKANYKPLAVNILKTLAVKIGYQTSVLWLVRELQKNMKISKQSVFDEVLELEKNYMLTWIKHYHKNVKKPYFSNFALRDSLSIKKDFKKTFENAVLCELLKFESDIFYTSFLDFYIPKLSLGFICEPFLDPSLARLKVKKIKQDVEKLGVKNLTFITNNIFDSFDGVNVLPFYEWALGL